MLVMRSAIHHSLMSRSNAAGSSLSMAPSDSNHCTLRHRSRALQRRVISEALKHTSTTELLATVIGLILRATQAPSSNKMRAMRSRQSRYLRASWPSRALEVGTTDLVACNRCNIQRTTESSSIENGCIKRTAIQKTASSVDGDVLAATELDSSVLIDGRDLTSSWSREDDEDSDDDNEEEESFGVGRGFSRSWMARKWRAMLEVVPDHTMRRLQTVHHMMSGSSRIRNTWLHTHEYRCTGRCSASGAGTEARSDVDIGVVPEAPRLRFALSLVVVVVLVRLLGGGGEDELVNRLSPPSSSS